MNKKSYKTPAMQVVNIKMSCQLLAGSGNVNQMSGNTELKYGGAGSGNARSRDGGSWDNED